jgi:hypothetical protein
MATKLNERLQPKDAPIATRINPTPGYEFNYLNQRDSVSAIHIKDFNFSAGVGGTISLGGALNAGGEVQIYNDTNTELAELDNNGIVLLGTTSLRYYDSNVGTYSMNFGPMSGTAFIQVTSGIPLTIVSGTTNLNGVINLTGTVVSPFITDGTHNNAVLGTPIITGGSLISGTILSPAITGTATFDINASTATLAANGNFAVQTFGGSAVLTVRVGGTNFRFISDGTF